ncbi:MAG: hypothetical protein LBV69_11660 [Bacteroidales bacterium]|jgi:hypothetical protein|nr:hypothetical protein [Bacteroidales bacterium]
MEKDRLEKLFEEFEVKNSEKKQIFGGTKNTENTCFTTPTQHHDNGTGVPNSGALCGPDPDYEPDVEDVTVTDPDDRPYTMKLTNGTW